MNTLTKINWIDLLHEIGPELKKNVKRTDKEALFVEDNYHLLKEKGFLNTMIPAELGGDDVSHAEMCELIEELAGYCSSTALALAMHQHLLAASIWKYRQGKGGGEMLAKVASNNLVLISTGARDWLESNGELRRTKGGYIFNGYKFFASQSAFGDVAVTSAKFKHETDGDQVLHFAVPMICEGVSLLNDWDTMGMRGTGSQTIVFKDVFVPDEAITLRRPTADFHPFFNVVIGVAMPLIMSVYVGIAKKAYRITRSALENQPRLKPHSPYQLGELYNVLTQATVLHQDMIRLSDQLKGDFDDSLAVEMLTRKTGVANACIETVSKAFETVGGKAYYKSTGLEILFRDVQAAQYHPLAEKDQQLFTGKYLLKNNNHENTNG
jgi:alkylation response protein AidB-like acyl-CoA dehydrogenase